MMRVGQLLVVCVATVMPACVSFGQTAGDLLQEAAATLRDSRTLQAGLSVRGEGAEMFRSTLPTGISKIRLKQVLRDADEDAGNTNAIEWVVRLTGRGTTGSVQEPDPVDFDLVRAKAHDRWIDHKASKVYEMPSARAMSVRSSAYMASRLHVPTELLQSEPLKDELAASEVSLLPETVEIEGVKCHVVEVTYEQAQAAPGRASRLNQRAKFYIGVNDQLIRRIDRISGSGALSMTIVLEFSGMEAGLELDADAFEIAVPEGYELSTSSSGGAGSLTTTPTRTRAVEGVQTPRAIDRSPIESYPSAPDFSVKSASGDSISLESLRGSPTVLYFWGTWCMECREYNPLVSDLAGEYADGSVRVIGIAVRERDPSAAASLASIRNYAFETVPDGSAAAKAFNVEVFPTIVVLNEAGGIVGTEQVRRGVTSRDVMSRVRGHLVKAAPSGGAGDQPDSAEIP